MGAPFPVFLFPFSLEVFIMAGLITPTSAYPVSDGNTFPYIYIGKGANSKHEQTLGVVASLGANSIWRLRFLTPPVIPSETMKLRLLALADATTGNAQVNPAWEAVSPEEDPSAVTLTAEGTTQLSWGASDDDQYKELKITLDAATAPTSNQVIVMDITFVTSGWTLAETSGWIPSIIWE